LTIWASIETAPASKEQQEEQRLDRARTTTPNAKVATISPKEIIDIDSFKIPSKRTDQPLSKCQGYILAFPPGKTPYSAYPFALHDSRSLPWDFEVNNGVMTLFSRTCSHTLPSPNTACRSCASLPKNKSLEGIITRLENGVHLKLPFIYHGVGGLIEVLHRKGEQNQFLRLRGLNQARSLLGKATALSDYKRLVLAIASGKVSRVSQVVNIALEQRKGVNGIISTLQDAAKGFYHPRSYTEEEDMWGLLTWRLAGNRVAHINHRSGHGPSVTYLRGRSIMAPIIPSPGKPNETEVMKNFNSTFESILDLFVTSSSARVRHIVLMFDELALEKRLRWDPKTNHFLGLCRQHAHKTSIEFINEGDLEEVFRALDEGDVHYAPEVRRSWDLLPFASASRPLIDESILGNNRCPRYPLQ